ncbi:VOC family metalloprotein YjdN [Cedecea neteri]|uniref:VOC family metalloprotein YjdN n=1 Tax=Cedecea neteri TaxID=158822 RepID=UPI0005D855D4|nr:VOC family metalloprotein YjdN [Cedecea neteri]AJZ87741.1 hypothetical protein VW41_01100 [Klebsiella michiganensis]WPU22748.1 VOC family metalloprotein YjdN [Cedecea neteri]
MPLGPYISLNGRCAEAIAFYQHALGAELTFKITFGEMPKEATNAEGCSGAGTYADDSIMHANLRVAGNDLMMTDASMSGEKPQHSGFSLCLASHDPAEGKRWFDALSAGGTVTMPWSETFWAKGYGSLTDKFGIPWMVNVER